MVCIHKPVLIPACLMTTEPAGVATGPQGDPEPVASFALGAKSSYVMSLSEDAPI